MALLALVLCLLTGSVGVAATQRFCAMLGMSSPAAAAKMQRMGCCQKARKNHCAKDQNQAQLDKKCCSVATTYHKLDITTSLKFNKVELAALPPMLLPSHFFTLLVPVQSSGTDWPLYSDTSPPLTGRELLQRIQLLRI